MIKKILFLYLLIFIFVFAYACGPKLPPKLKLDANQLRSLQLKEIDGDLDSCFKASLFILQDEGWIIKVADKSNGILQAESLRTKSSYSPELDFARTKWGEKPGWHIINTRWGAVEKGEWERWEEAFVYLEQLDNNTTRVRLNRVKKGTLPQIIHSTGLILRKIDTTPEQSSAVVVDDPNVYGNFFARLKKEVLRRQNLNK